MLRLAVAQRHLGEWISVHAHAEKSPPRLTVTMTFGELPEGWARAGHHARTWAALLGLVCILLSDASLGNHIVQYQVAPLCGSVRVGTR